MSGKSNLRLKMSTGLDEVAFTLKKQVHNLGLLLDPGLLLNKQIIAVSRSDLY